MAMALLGKKVGMTRLFDDRGVQQPVTIIEAGPCYVSQIKRPGRDGYSAVQIAYEDVKARRSTMPQIGHDADAGLSPKRHHREIRVEAEQLEQYELGQALTVDGFQETRFVDVVGTSKGKGFAGSMKRWNFKGQPKTHGTKRKHRSPGSVNGRASNLGGGRPKKGIKMPGRMGGARNTVRSLDLVRVDAGRGLLLVKGSVPGAKGEPVLVREAVRLSRKKAMELAAS